MKSHFAASLSVIRTRQGLKSLANSHTRQGLKSLANSESPLKWTEYKLLVHFNGLKLLARKFISGRAYFLARFVAQ